MGSETARVYRVAVPHEAAVPIERKASGMLPLTLMWTLVTSVGVGLGWYVALESGSWLWFGVVLGLFQAVAFLPELRLAGLWVAATTVGWWVGLAAMFGVQAVLQLRILTEWRIADFTANITDIGWALGLFPFVAVPIMALMQWLVLRRWEQREPAVLWIGAMFCSFPVAGFVTLLVVDRQYSNDISGFLVSFGVSSWMVGALWGLATGLALGRMSGVVRVAELVSALFPASRMPWQVLLARLVALWAMVFIVCIRWINPWPVIGSFIAYYPFDRFLSGPQWPWVLMYVALGFALCYSLGFVRAMGVCLAVGGVDMALAIWRRLSDDYGGLLMALDPIPFWQEVIVDLMFVAVIYVALFLVLASAGAALARWMFRPRVSVGFRGRVRFRGVRVVRG